METKHDETCETLQSGRVSRIIQIHPSLYCNLSCKHCYSSSAPGIKDQLDVRLLADIVGQARAIGYNVISMSGGEPFLYGSLEELFTYSKSLGFFNSVTTNGMLLKSDRAKRILKLLDLVAVSIDGKEEFHDAMRCQQGAFKKMLGGVEVLKDSIEHFGFIHTVLPSSWKLLPWLAEFATDHEAGLLHLHPLEISGRAKENFYGLTFSESDLYKIYIAHFYLKTHYEKQLFIQLDLLHRDNIIGNPNFIFHQNFKPELNTKGFSSVFKELIINEKGDILPIAHGCSDFFKIGNVHSKEKLNDMIKRFMEEKFQFVAELYQSTYDEIVNNGQFEIFNWSEMVIQKSHEMFSLAV